MIQKMPEGVDSKFRLALLLENKLGTIIGRSGQRGLPIFPREPLRALPRAGAPNVFVVAAPIERDKLVAGKDKLHTDTSIPTAGPGAVPAHWGLAQGSSSIENRQQQAGGEHDPLHGRECRRCDPV